MGSPGTDDDDDDDGKMSSTTTTMTTTKPGKGPMTKLGLLGGAAQTLRIEDRCGGAAEIKVGVEGPGPELRRRDFFTRGPKRPPEVPTASPGLFSRLGPIFESPGAI